MTEEQIGVCVIVENAEGKLLLGKRKGSFRKGYYGFPGGKLEMGEKLITCARRELKEETGLQGNKFEFVGVTKEFEPENNYNFIAFVFYCRNFDGNPTNTEPEKCEGWEWYSLDQIPQNILEGHQWALDMYVKRDVPLRDIK